MLLTLFSPTPCLIQISFPPSSRDKEAIPAVIHDSQQIPSIPRGKWHISGHRASADGGKVADVSVCSLWEDMFVLAASHCTPRPLGMETLQWHFVKCIVRHWTRPQVQGWELLQHGFNYNLRYLPFSIVIISAMFVQHDLATSSSRRRGT